MFKSLIFCIIKNIMNKSLKAAEKDGAYEQEQ